MVVFESIQYLSSAASSSANLVLHIFDVAALLGQLILQKVLQTTDLAVLLFKSLGTFVSILGEDFYKFVVDVSGKIHLVLWTIISFVTSITEGISNAICFGLDVYGSFSSALFDTFLFVIMLLLKIGYGFARLVYLALTSLSFLGTSFLEFFTSFPIFLQHLVLCTYFLITNPFLYFGSYLKLQYGNFMTLLMNIPKASYLGCLLGFAICLAVIANFSNVIQFVTFTIRYISNILRITLHMCWTGDFFRDENLNSAEVLENVSFVREGSVNSVQQEPRESHMCIVCLDNPRNMLFLPCRHVSVCQICCLKLGPNCPLCRKRIKKSMPIFV